jgi:hypothetical protein
MNKDDDAANAARYYANPAEQKVLVAGLQRYFALPERSQNRNRIAKEVSQYLRYFSPHWSHRAVRLWFNNNKHTYFGNESDPAPPPAAAPPAPPPPPVSRIPLPQIVPPASGPILLPPIQVPVLSPKVHFSEKAPPLPVICGAAPAPFQTLNPISFGFARTSSAEPSLEQSYAPITGMLNDIKRLPEGDPRYAKLLQDFDTACNNLCARFGSIQADKADTTARFSSCPVKREPSQLDLHLLDLMPESISTSDILDLPLRSLSFTHQLISALGKRVKQVESIWMRYHSEHCLGTADHVPFDRWGFSSSGSSICSCWLLT